MIANLQHIAHAAGTPEARKALEARFTDLAPPLTARQAAIESARCLYCYDAPCTRACPSEIDIASFISHIANDNVNGAAQVILQQNILGASCARVCPTEILCEQACVRNHGQEGQPVKIGLLQRHATDHMVFPVHPFVRASASGKTVAVVGAGPAGLSCAHRLAMLGHEVVVFEARAKPGGLNEYGIAKYKLTDAIAQKEIAFLLEIGGITIRYGQVLGANLSLQDLHASYDAVFLGLGLAASRRLGLAGEDAPGLLAAVDYIAALRQAEDLTQMPVPARAIVLGAGNTAIDIAVQLVRLGAQEVSLVYRRDAGAMSATGHERQIALQHGVRMLTWAQPQQVLLDDAGRVRGMRFEKTALEAGVLQATGATFEIAAEGIFKAIGQSLDSASLRGALAAQVQREGGRTGRSPGDNPRDKVSEKIVVDVHLRTSVAGIYAGGDCVGPGQDLTVQAVQHGKLAAQAIDFDLRAAPASAFASASPTASSTVKA
jgi:dihydropyrimidine dehydrogenase (NAD+) subunit PreT